MTRIFIYSSSLRNFLFFSNAPSQSYDYDTSRCYFLSHLLLPCFTLPVKHLQLASLVSFGPLSMELTVT